MTRRPLPPLPRGAHPSLPVLAVLALALACGGGGPAPGASGGDDGGGGGPPTPAAPSGGSASVTLALAWGGGSDEDVAAVGLELADAVVFVGRDGPPVSASAGCDRSGGTSAGLTAALRLDLRASGEATLARVEGVDTGDLREVRLFVRDAKLERRGRDEDAAASRRCRGDDGAEWSVVSVRPDRPVRLAAGQPVTLVIRLDPREDVRGDALADEWTCTPR